MTMSVLTIMARRPYSAFSGEVGSQRELPRNSAILISRKAGTAVVTRVRKMPTRTSTAVMPEAKKKALTADSFRSLRFLRFIAVRSLSALMSCSMFIMTGWIRSPEGPHPASRMMS